VRIGRDETRLQRILERYTRDVWRRAPDGADGARLAMTILRKRALSSPSALLRSLTRRLELLQGTITPPAQLSLFDDPLESDDALPDAALAAPGLPDAGREARRLTALIDAAALADAADSKARRLVRLLSALRGESAIVFTEYRDTLRRLATLLPDALHLHGGLTHAERAEVQRRFNADGGVLLATDAAADGLNLQQRCRLVVNFELPWNPARLEQRIGRVDRIGQRRVVHALTFVARDTAEDLVVARLARRLARVAATLGERDRLASLVSDVRTARAVVAGAPLEIDVFVDGAPPLPRASSADFDADRIAPQAGRIGASGDVSRAAVARLRASRFVEPGVVAVFRAAVVEDRGVVADRAFIFHLSIPLLSKPRSRREALDLARAAIESIERRAPGRADVREWMDGVMRVHDAAVARRIAREQAMRHEPDAVEVQPGLFDPRALRQAVRLEADEDERRREHDDHLRALEASRAVRLECRVAALLTVWR
jgi:hypothetical protein